LAVVHYDEIVGYCSRFEHHKSDVTIGVEKWAGER
jgi:hypothetical protein